MNESAVKVSVSHWGKVVRGPRCLHYLRLWPPTFWESRSGQDPMRELGDKRIESL